MHILDVEVSDFHYQTITQSGLTIEEYQAKYGIYIHTHCVKHSSDEYWEMEEEVKQLAVDAGLLKVALIYLS
jgi:hypothetical protein